MSDVSAGRRRDSRSLRIGIDAHAIGARKTGNERFIANLVPALRTKTDDDLVIYVTTDEGERAMRALATSSTTVRRVRPSHPLIRVPISMPLQARRDRLDVLFVQYTAGPLLPCPVVPVVHDVAFWRHPEYFPRLQRAWMRRAIPATIHRASEIVTVSRFSKDEIVTAFGTEPDRITVAHEAADDIFFGSPMVDAGIEPPYVLAIGNLQRRKNLGVLLDAFKLLASRDPTFRERLIIVGQDAAGAPEIRAQAGDLIASGRVVFTGYVADERVVALLAGATAFAYPSLYEGFGLPVLEAMAAGVPTIVSDIPVMREIAGDAARFVPATDVSAWAAAVNEVASHPERRDTISSAGRRHARTFSWDATADAILGALERAAGRR